MKRNVPQATGPTTATEGDETLDDTFDALADPDCRAILGAADTAMTTSELADACDIALSTAYRKVERLSETRCWSKASASTRTETTRRSTRVERPTPPSSSATTASR